MATPLTIRDQLVRLRPQLIAYAKAICSRADDADDLVHDAIERALKAPDPPRAPADLTPWMFRIIRNLYIDGLRKAKVRAEYAASHERLSGVSQPQDSDLLQSLLVRQALDALAPHHREVIFLVDIMGMRYAEAAEILGTAEGTIMSRLSRARGAMIAHVKGSNVSPMRRRRN